MSLLITEECIDCAACTDVCPHQAISHDHRSVVDPARCTECVGYEEAPECVRVCPVECIVIDPAHIESLDALPSTRRSTARRRRPSVVATPGFGATASSDLKIRCIHWLHSLLSIHRIPPACHRSYGQYCLATQRFPGGRRVTASWLCRESIPFPKLRSAAACILKTIFPASPLDSTFGYEI